jgi:hypothetical protein
MYRRIRCLSTLAGIILVICLYLSLLPLISAHPADSDPGHDTILFTNGDHLTGRFLGATSTSVEFEGKVTGTLSFDWSDIKEMELDGGTLNAAGKNALEKDTPRNFVVTEASVENNGTELVFKQKSQEARKVPLDNLASVTPDTPAHWRGLLQTQDSIVGATQKQYQLGGGLGVTRTTQDKHKFKRQVTSINLQAAYGESKKPDASPVITGLFDGSLQHNVYLQDTPSSGYGGAYVFGLTDFYRNVSLGMNFQQTYGGGIGWDTQYGGSIFGFAADVRYIDEQVHSATNDLNLAGSGLSEHESLTLSFPKKHPFSIFERVTFIPTFNESRTYQARGIAGLDMPVSARLSLGVQFTDDYLRNAPAKTNQNYSKTALTLKYAIGPLPAKAKPAGQ